MEALGLAIFRQDSAAWVASDALQAKVPDLRSAHALGWIVEEAGAGQRVRFLRDVGKGPEVGWDIDVTPDLKTTVSEPADRTLSASEAAMWAARQTAVAGMAGAPTCRPGYNVVVLKDPEQPGWLVWLLAPLPANNVWPIGGHYRFSISPDGKQVLRRDALSASCIAMDPKQGGVPQGSTVTALTVSHIVSPTPVETHVFIHLQSKIPMIVLAGEHVWGIEHGQMSDMGLLSELAKAKP